MEIRNCRKCKKIFQYLNGPVICPACKEEEEEQFQQVKQYLKENPRASMTDVSQALDISVEKITRFLREGRLQIASDSPIKLQCESCGKEIMSGRYCTNCSGKLEGDFKTMSKDLIKKSTQTPQRMMKYLKNNKQ